MLNGMISVVHINGPSEILSNVDLMCKLLKDIVKAINMTPHGDPYVVYYPDNSNAKGTVTIMQCLHESFIIYDNWPELEYAHIVVDSCNPYDLNKVIETISNYPGLKSKPENSIIRYNENVFKNG